MRSRYSAYIVEAIEYLGDTHHPDKREEFDRASALAWARGSEWIGLEIVEAEQAGDDEGYVEFKARYSRDGSTVTHHERSRFVKIKDRWYYDDGRLLAEPVKRAMPKVGRNDPCVCGSGKKYKKCCGGR